MRRQLAPALACLALTLSGLAVAVAPAYAEGEPVISAIDLSTPGHAKGTVTTTAPYVAVVLRGYYTQYELSAPAFIPVSAGSAAFDLEGWGIDDPVVVSARSCTTQLLASCGMPGFSDAFVPLDVEPQIAWPEDTTIGTGQEYAISVIADPGGGELVAEWSRDSIKAAIDPDGSTSLPLSIDGAGEVRVSRCQHYSPGYYCHDTGLIHSLTVNREIWATASLPQVANDTPISPALGTKLTVNIFVDEPGPVTLDWHLERVSDGSTVIGFGGQIAGYGYGAPKETQLDLSGLGNGSYRFVGSTSKESIEFGTVTGDMRQQPEFRVDNTAPVIGAVTKTDTSIYPYKDGYRDSASVSVPRTSYSDIARLKIVSDSTGQTIRTLAPYCNSCSTKWTFPWNGRVYPDTPAPAGTYSLTLSITDKAGNHSEASAGKLTIVRRKTEAHTFRKSVTAAASKVDQRVGRCSTLRQPSLRGWAGSLGYYTNTKCRRTFDNSLVLTVHALRTPRGAVKYGVLRMWSYGGAAKAAPRSLAYFEILNRDDEWNEASTRMSPTLSSHGGAERVGAHFVFDDRYLIWRAYTAEGAKYDIKNFSVRLKYFVLIPE